MMDCPHIPRIPYREFSDLVHTQAGGKRIPVNGSMEITLRCNLRCVHCYGTVDPRKKELSFPEICRILDQIAESGCLWLLITGGEPLLRPDLLDIYAYAKNKGMIITLFTNGTLLTPAVADFLREFRPFAVEISLYGMTRATYEGITRVPGSFHRCLRGIDLLLERGISLRLKTMVVPANRHELSQMKTYAHGLGVEFRYDALLNPRLDGSKDPCGLRLSPEEVVELDLADEKRSQGWREFCEKSPRPGPTDLLFACSAGRSAFHIDPYGDLNICLMARDHGVDLRSASFQEVWGGSVPQILTARRSEKNPCRLCTLRNLCDSCAGWAGLETGDPERPVEYLCRIAHLRADAFGFNENRNETTRRRDHEQKAQKTLREA